MRKSVIIMAVIFGIFVAINYSISEANSLKDNSALTKQGMSKIDADLKVHLLAGIASINKHEVQIVMIGNKIYLPLREIIEILGYQVNWDGKNHLVMLLKGAEYVEVMIGNNDYQKGEMWLKLTDVPQIVDGKTVVPIDFFDKVLGLNVQLIKGHI